MTAPTDAPERAWDDCEACGAPNAHDFVPAPHDPAVKDVRTMVRLCTACRHANVDARRKAGLLP